MRLDHAKIEVNPIDPRAWYRTKSAKHWMKVFFVEPPKDTWFVVEEYLPPQCGIIQRAAYLEREVKDSEAEVLDCNAEQVG